MPEPHSHPARPRSEEMPASSTPSSSPLRADAAGERLAERGDRTGPRAGAGSPDTSWPTAAGGNHSSGDDVSRVTRRVPTAALDARADAQNIQQPGPSPSERGPESAAGLVDPGRVIGRCHAIYAFDIGLAVDTTLAGQIIREHERRKLVRRWRVPKWVQYRVPPLTFSWPVDPVSIGGWTTRGQAVFTVFDFGAVSVRFEIDIDAPVEHLVALSEELYDHPGLQAASEARVRDLVTLLRPAIRAPELGVATEDYVIFEFTAWSEAPEPADFIRRHGPAVASILVADRGPLSPAEVQRCLDSSLSYSAHDLSLVHWHAAAIFHADAADVLTVLEHANVELLELREIDHELDGLLDQCRGLIGRGIRDYLWPMSHASRRARDLIALHTDHALMFEGVTNAIKLFGDEYLARLHRLTARQLNAPEWHANVARKLDAAEGVYDRIIQQEGNRRMEILEIIIILLIAVSILLPFISSGGAGH